MSAQKTNFTPSKHKIDLRAVLGRDHKAANPVDEEKGTSLILNDQNVTVETTYNADSLALTLTAKNPTTGDQTTQYQYGTTLATSAIVRNDLLVATIYPDASDSADRVTNTYKDRGLNYFPIVITRHWRNHIVPERQHSIEVRAE